MLHRHINKINQLRVDPKWHNLWGSGQGSQSGVGDVKEIMYIEISLIGVT